MVGLLMFVAFAADEPEPSAVTVNGTNDFEIRYWSSDQRLLDPDDVPVFNYVEQVNRLNLKVAYDAWSLDAQVDEVALFANQYYLDDVLYVERELLLEEVRSPTPGFSFVTLEKLRATYESKETTLSLGDTYAAFGRGLALNLNRNVDIDLDTSVTGVKSVVRTGNWDLTAVAGLLNRQQVFQDNPNLNIAANRMHSVGGARAEVFGVGPANLGGHVVVYDFATEPGLQAGINEIGGGLDTIAAGATAELLGVAGVDWFVEADVYTFGAEMPAPLEEAADEPGYALYGSASFYPGNFAVVIEGKRYYQVERVNALLAPELYEVSVGPTLEYERAITEDSSAAVNSNDAWGTRAQVDWVLKPGALVPYAAVGIFRDTELGGLHFNDVPETIVHPMLGVEIIGEHSVALLNAGYRVDDRDGSEAGADRQLHGDATVNWPLFAGLQANLNLGAEWYRWGINPFQQEPYTEVESGITVSRGPIAFNWYTDYTTNPLVNSTGNFSERVYGAAEVQVKPSPATTIRAFYGAYKAGIRCSGGQCRQLPGFEGARASFTTSF